MQRRVAGESNEAPPKRPTPAIPPGCAVSASARTHAVGPTENWSPVNAAGLRWALWEQDNVVFHIETGETHILSELPTLLLEMLQSGPIRTTGELCQASADACGALADAPWQEKVSAVLRGLENLELVERLPAPGA